MSIRLAFVPAAYFCAGIAFDPLSFVVKAPLPAS